MVGRWEPQRAQQIPSGRNTREPEQVPVQALDDPLTAPLLPIEGYGVTRPLELEELAVKRFLTDDRIDGRT